MSIDEIRTQKALTLLEFKEAGDNLHVLEKQKDVLAEEFRKFGSDLKSEAREECRRQVHLTAQAALDLLQKIAEARTQFVAVEERRSSSGSNRHRNYGSLEQRTE